MKWLLRLGINRGLLGGSRIFGALGTAALFVRLIQRAAGTGEKTLYTHKLQKDEVLVVTDREPSQ